MWMDSRSLLALLLLFSTALQAQVESLGPLHAQPQAAAGKAMLKSDLNEVFIYQFDPQELPIVDDFSVARTRSLWSQAGDPGVTLDQVYYRLEVAGISAADMVFSTDTSFSYMVDTVGVDTIVVTPNPSSQVVVYDIDVYPVTSMTITAWPPYSIWDTVGFNSPDTIGINPDLVQDSLFVYTVAPDPRTYLQNGVQVPFILWEDDHVYINGTYPVDPPTIGVATFDGLDRTGFPYRFDQPTAYGRADRMTSVPIDLDYVVGDSLYLSFYFQPQGLSGDDQVQPIDSLLLEFYAPLEDRWYLVWWSEYFPLAPFQEVMLPITDERFLHDGFRMRFVNKGTLSGALDHWHLDYLRLGAQRTFDDTVLVDVAFVYPESTLLQTYTSIPFKVFEQNAAGFMAGQVEETMKNLDVVDKFITWGANSGLDGGPLTNAFGAGNNISNNASSTFISTHAVAPFFYDPALSTDFAFWRTKFWLNATPNINLYNDTLELVQEISNYYAYDDGSAEAGYSLNVAGAKMAYRFDLPTGDSLRAFRAYFDPVFEDPSNGSFILTVWTSLNPEVIQHQNFSFSTPQYRMDGLNHFVEYALDSVIWVEGTIYIGWVQTTADKLNLGFDKNRNNQDKIFYKTSGPFLGTGFQGSLMLRPVFVANEDPFLAIDDEAPVEAPELLAFPNPVTDAFRIRWNGEMVSGGRLQVVDLSGRMIGDWAFVPGTPVLVGSAAPGMYLVRLVDKDGRPLGETRIIVSK